jgi:hypothetical protein
MVFFVAVAVTGCDSGGGDAAALDVDKSDVEKYNEMMADSMAGYEEAESAIKEGE